MATPISEWDKFKNERPEVAVAMAWSVPGINPQWHHERKELIRKEMPLLAKYLDQLVENLKANPS